MHTRIKIDTHAVHTLTKTNADTHTNAHTYTNTDTCIDLKI